MEEKPKDLGAQGTLGTPSTVKGTNDPYFILDVQRRVVIQLGYPFKEDCIYDLHRKACSAFFEEIQKDSPRVLGVYGLDIQIQPEGIQEKVDLGTRTKYASFIVSAISRGVQNEDLTRCDPRAGIGAEEIE